VKILVTGATGFIGSRLVDALVRDGHTVTALSRDPESARRRLPALAGAHPWGPLDGPPPPAAYEGVDAVVHLAAEPVNGRWTQAKRRRIRDTRVLGTRYLVDGLLAASPRPRVLVSASAIGVYGPRGEEEVTEETPPGSDWLSGVAREWEAEAERAASQDVRVVVLRNGLVLGSGGAAYNRLLLATKLFVGGPLGGGRQWWSWVHVDDVVGMFCFALAEDSLAGAVNVTAPHPARQRDVARALGKALRRPSFVPAPAFALRIVLGAFAREVLGSIRVLPVRAQRAGYRFRHPELGGAIRDLTR
jgi:uncharacterized protein (TIGR01777 family)